MIQVSGTWKFFRCIPTSMCLCLYTEVSNVRWAVYCGGKLGVSAYLIYNFFILLTVKTCLAELKILGNFRNRLLNMWILFKYFEMFLAGKLSKHTTLKFYSIEIASFSWYLPPTMETWKSLETHKLSNFHNLTWNFVFHFLWRWGNKENQGFD